MSVEQLEKQIRDLPDRDLVQLTKWFGTFLADRMASENADWQESAAQIAELNQRLAEFEADPGVATPFEADYFDKLKDRLADERAKKASAR